MERACQFLAAVLWLCLAGAEALKLYTASNGEIYYVDNQKTYNWYEARYECASVNMTPITPNTLDRQMEISKIFKAYSFYEVWTAGRNDAPTNFVWTTTGENLTYTNWEQGETTRCIGISHEVYHYWISKPCSTARLYLICEQPPHTKRKISNIFGPPEIQDVTNSNVDENQAAIEAFDKELFATVVRSELKELYDLELNVLRKSHDIEMHEKQAEITNLRADNERQLGQLKEFHEREITLLMEEKNSFKNAFERVTKYSNMVHGYQFNFNAEGSDKKGNK